MPTTSRGGWASVILVLLGTVGGILLLGGIRFVAQPPEHAVHFHANWAIYIDGERLDLTATRYMEDVAACTADPTHQRPEDRVHMHDGNHEIVHVHAAGVTWGHLLANLWFGIGDDYLETDAGRFASAEGRSLKFILNGAPVRSIRNLAIGDEDRLLISYGGETVEEVIASQFPQVASTASEFNAMPDPASCSGQHQAGVGERLRRAVWF